MTLPIEPPFPPMEATPVSELPRGDEWRYEPKWDGFRCLAFRDGADVRLQSKACKPLERYFPDVVEAVASLAPRRFVLDGELAIPVRGRFSFDDLLLRLHPAESRVRKLASEHRATYVLFDLLVDERGRSLVKEPLRGRRPRLDAFFEKFVGAERPAAFRLSPMTEDRARARRWLEGKSDVDGVIAKLADAPYRSGERSAMMKIKKRRTADCVVGGFRYSSAGKHVGSLLLGLYEPETGLLHHVGFTSSLPEKERKEITPRLERLVRAPGFTGRAPGGPSRWNTERSTEWEPLAPKLVVEVSYDRFTGGRFRHGTRFLRWRPDKAPEQCTFDQIDT